MYCHYVFAIFSHFPQFPTTIHNHLQFLYTDIKHVRKHCETLPRFVSLLALKVSICSHEQLMLLSPSILMFNTPPYISFLFFYSFSRQMRQIFTSDTLMSELETPKFQRDLVRHELQLSLDPLLRIKMILYQHRVIVEMTMGN